MRAAAQATPTAWGVVCALAPSIALGALIATQPVFGIAMTLIALGVVAVVRGLQTPASRFLVLTVLAVSATIDLIGRVEVGPTSAYAWVTALIAATSTFLALLLPITRVPRAGRRTLLVMSLYPAWALMSVAGAPPSQAGVQNLLVYVSFPSIAAVTAVAITMRAMPLPRLENVLFTTFAAGSLLFAGSLILDKIGGHAIVSSRAYAAFAAIGVAWAASRARYGGRSDFGLPLVLVGLILVSLSRTAFVAALFVLALAFVGLRTPRDLRRSVVILAAIAALGAAAVTYSNPFSSRFTSGDVVALPGGVDVNVMGRADLWSVTWDLAWRSPIFGTGAGSADEAVKKVAKADHPHNDYLRALADFGFVGAGLLAAALAAPVIASGRALRMSTTKSDNPWLLAGALAPTALALEMVTDNSLVYLFVVAPTAVLVGAAVARMPESSRRAEATWDMD